MYFFIFYFILFISIFLIVGSEEQMQKNEELRLCCCGPIIVLDRENTCSDGVLVSGIPRLNGGKNSLHNAQHVDVSLNLEAIGDWCSLMNFVLLVKSRKRSTPQVLHFFLLLGARHWTLFFFLWLSLKRHQTQLFCAGLGWDAELGGVEAGLVVDGDWFCDAITWISEESMLCGSISAAINSLRSLLVGDIQVCTIKTDLPTARGMHDCALRWTMYICGPRPPAGICGHKNYPQGIPDTSSYSSGTSTDKHCPWVYLPGGTRAEAEASGTAWSSTNIDPESRYIQTCKSFQEINVTYGFEKTHAKLYIYSLDEKKVWKKGIQSNDSQEVADVKIGSRLPNSFLLHGSSPRPYKIERTLKVPQCLFCPFFRLIPCKEFKKEAYTLFNLPNK
ncbi:putative signal peptide protein [Puccinia sorghi]|uniref:Putative signal peptide protein n=1 Tax=Puccinia sorghi TaxID=27349 RepID=A0A0L6UFA1_9BASI|nr:putative signal peptide protein [Puccinia sorghi]